MIEPELSKEASKAYVYGKIFDVSLEKMSSEKERIIKKIIKNYKDELKDIHYQLLKNTKDRVEIDDKNLTNFVIENTQDILKKLSEEEQEQIKQKLLYNAKRNIKEGIRLRNAYNRIYCKIKKQGMQDSELERETCKAYLYLKISKMGFFSIVISNKKTTENIIDKLYMLLNTGFKIATSERIIPYNLMDNETIKKPKSSEWKADYYHQKAQMINKFYQYVQENHQNNYQTSWSDWLKTHE